MVQRRRGGGKENGRGEKRRDHEFPADRHFDDNIVRVDGSLRGPGRLESEDTG